jgi:hypothetical protein
LNFSSTILKTLENLSKLPFHLGCFSRGGGGGGGGGGNKRVLEHFENINIMQLQTMFG